MTNIWIMVLLFAIGYTIAVLIGMVEDRNKQIKGLADRVETLTKEMGDAPERMKRTSVLLDLSTEKLIDARDDMEQLRDMYENERRDCWQWWKKFTFEKRRVKNRMDTIYSYQKQINDLRMQKMEAEYVAKNAAFAVYCVMDMVVRRLRNNLKNRTESIYSYQRQIEDLRMQKMEVESRAKKLDEAVTFLSGLRYKVTDLEAENIELRNSLKALKSRNVGNYHHQTDKRRKWLK